jgi:hypothetical protein
MTFDAALDFGLTGSLVPQQLKKESLLGRGLPAALWWG